MTSHTRIGHHVLACIVSILLCQLAGIIGSFFTFSAIPNWYAFLEKPVLNPPSEVFGPVWTILYALMGIAFFEVWKKAARSAGGYINALRSAYANPSGTSMSAAERKAMRIFALQLILNASWSIVFFGLKSPFWALVIIVAMLIAIIGTIVRFLRVSKLAGWLLAPYLAWVAFATYLNFGIWMLN